MVIFAWTHCPGEKLVQEGGNMSCTCENGILWLFLLGQHDFHRDASSYPGNPVKITFWLDTGYLSPGACAQASW